MVDKLELDLDLNTLGDFARAESAVEEWLERLPSEIGEEETSTVRHLLECYIEWKKEVIRIPYTLNKVCQKIYDDGLKDAYDRLPDYAKWRS